jgi:hypothetical protein
MGVCTLYEFHSCIKLGVYYIMPKDSSTGVLVCMCVCVCIS